PPVDTTTPPPVDTTTPPPVDTTTPPPVDTTTPPPVDTTTPPPVDTTTPPPVDTTTPPPVDTTTPPPVDTTAPTPAGPPVVGLNGSFQGRRIFPVDDPWNMPVDGLPVDPNSAAILARIGLTDRLHPDFGASYDGGPFGIPYIVVPDTLTRSPVQFDYDDESDPGPYPIPADPPIEPGGGDRHLLVVVKGEYKVYELYNLRREGGAWRAGSGAIFDLTHGTTRPAGWTSADAAGLPILPGLVRYDEVHERGEITHAIRFTVQRTRRAYIAPARHWASSSTNPLDLPMGARVRLKASFDETPYSPAMRVIIRALKKYGMIVADNGSDFFITGTADARWNDGENNALKQIRASDFEVIEMTGIVAP
ncbi:MAG TPA: hypothetical protein VFN22_11225, partial [Gemmatimonadales bacterium]|nr:hypothetical protein [Gemmatimonadales bacterium]